MDKVLAKITHAEFGYGGYQDAQLGLSLQFASASTGCGHFDGQWGIERSEYAKWTEADRITGLGETCMRLKKLLDDAKCRSVSQLVGKPVELEIDINVLKGFRILTEVL